jgi:hypothetical protein
MNEMAELKARVAVLERHIKEIEMKMVAGGLIARDFRDGTQPTPDQVEQQRILTFGDDLAA